MESNVAPTSAEAGSVQAAVQSKLHKKAQEMGLQVVELLQNLPKAAEVGKGNRVDISA